jgi:hypothetical protein
VKSLLEENSRLKDDLSELKYENLQLREMIVQKSSADLPKTKLGADYANKNSQELSEALAKNKILETKNAIYRDLLKHVRNNLGPTRFKMGAYQVYISNLKSNNQHLREEVKSCRRQVTVILCNSIHIEYIEKAYVEGLLWM